MDSVQSPPEHPLLRRRNLAFPAKLTTANRHFPSSTLSSSFDSNNVELPSIMPAAFHSYSSLRDLLPLVAAVNSPKPKSEGSDICIRNRLVKQAAWAYLQPMSASPDSAGGNFFRRLWTGVATIVDFFCRNVFCAVDGTVRVIRIRFSGLQANGLNCGFV